jgi:hypothetical protein
MSTSTLETKGDVHFNSYVARFGAFGSFSMYATGKRKDGLPYPLTNKDCGALCGQTLPQLRQIAHESISPKQTILEKVNAFQKHHGWENKFVVGMHFRGTDKLINWPHKSPSYETFATVIESVFKAAGCAGGRGYEATSGTRCAIFVATDESEVIGWLKNRFEYLSQDGTEVIFNLENAPRLSASDVQAQAGGTHKSTKFSAYVKGEAGVLDCLLLSKTKYIVKNRSSLSDVALELGDQKYWSFIIADDMIWHYSVTHDDVVRQDQVMVERVLP